MKQNLPTIAASKHCVQAATDAPKDARRGNVRRSGEELTGKLSRPQAFSSMLAVYFCAAAGEVDDLLGVATIASLIFWTSTPGPGQVQRRHAPPA